MSLIAMGVVGTLGILRSADWLPPIDIEAGQSLLKNYNTISHLLFITLLTIGCGWLLQLANIGRSRGLTEVGFDISSYPQNLGLR